MRAHADCPRPVSGNSRALHEAAQGIVGAGNSSVGCDWPRSRRIAGISRREVRRHRRAVTASAGQLAGPGENPVQHRLGEAAGEGVLLAGVVAADQLPVADARPQRRDRIGAWAVAPRHPSRPVPAASRPRRNRPGRRSSGNCRAARALGSDREGSCRARRGWPVGGGRAADDRGDVGVEQSQAVLASVDVGWLA